MQEQINQLKTKFEDMMNTVLSRPDEKWKGMQAVNYLFSVISIQNGFPKSVNGMPLSYADKVFLNEVQKIAKEYESKLYEIGKPFIKDYYEIKEDTFSKLNASAIMDIFNSCERLIKEEKVNPNHTEDLKGPQINIIKSFAYYVNKEFEDKTDSKCRAKYYEILKL